MNSSSTPFLLSKLQEFKDSEHLGFLSVSMLLLITVAVLWFPLILRNASSFEHLMRNQLSYVYTVSSEASFVATVLAFLSLSFETGEIPLPRLFLCAETTAQLALVLERTAFSVKCALGRVLILCAVLFYSNATVLALWLKADESTLYSTLAFFKALSLLLILVIILRLSTESYAWRVLATVSGLAAFGTSLYSLVIVVLLAIRGKEMSTIFPKANYNLKMAKILDGFFSVLFLQFNHVLGHFNSIEFISGVDTFVRLDGKNSQKDTIVDDTCENSAD